MSMCLWVYIHAYMFWSPAVMVPSLDDLTTDVWVYVCVQMCVRVSVHTCKHANVLHCAQFLQGYEWRSCVRGRGKGGEGGRGWFGKERWGYICSCKKREGFVHVVAGSVCCLLINGKPSNPVMVHVFEIVNLGWYNASFLKLSMSGVRAVKGPCSRR